MDPLGKGVRCVGSCLLRLKPGAQGEHLTSQFSWVAAQLLVTRVCPVYLLEELVVLVFYAPYDWADM